MIPLCLSPHTFPSFQQNKSYHGGRHCKHNQSIMKDDLLRCTSGREREPSIKISFHMFRQDQATQATQL